MSKVCYFASDTPLKDRPSPYMKSYSINEAIDAGIEIDLNMLSGIDRDKPDVILWIENEELDYYPSITISEKYREAPKTQKKYFADIHGHIEKDLEGILEYIHDHMKKKKDRENTKELELWYVWLACDEDDIIEKTCSLNELTEDYLKEIFVDEDIDYKITITR